jgi:site-specific recombinase XerD
MTGHKRDKYGWRCFVKVGTVQREKRFPADSTFQQREAWRDEARVALRKLPQAPTTKETFKADARRYLALPDVKGLRSYASRVCEIEAWYPHIGAVPRGAITRTHILTARSAWLAEGRAPKTINHRVRALRHLYRLLDGSRAATPADDIDRLKEPAANPQFVPPSTIRRVAMRLTDPKTRARFMVLAATGMRPAQLRRAVRTDVNFRTRLWLVRPAKGGNPIPMALTQDMIAAWRAFIAADAWGAFDGSEYAKALYRAGWPKTIRPYNVKHTVALTLANADAEWEDIKDFFGHTDVKTTRIYTGRVMKRLKGMAAKLEGRIGWK